MEIQDSVIDPRAHIRPYVKGKFIFVEGEKYFIKGVTYGTFKPAENGYQFPDYQTVENDFIAMAANGINSVRTYTVPPAYMLHLALKYGLKLMVGIPWEQHITFLDDDARRWEIIESVKNNVRLCAQHPAILCYTIGNEIPAPIVRWYGKKKVEKFLKQLYNAVKSIDSEGLVTYVNYPTTEYLDLHFLDFYSFNVYLETPEKLSAYLSKLHNICGNLPLVLAEIGMDTARNGESRQAATLDWQTRMIFGKGCAGMFVFSWTDEWWRGGADIVDWDFGVVDRTRKPKQALPVLKSVFNNVPCNNKINAPVISVVICTYNGSRTIRDCLEGLMRIIYPNFEVIVVNDGSTDNVATIVEEFPVRLINTPNMGLSNARNTGMMHSRGEIIAYIDDDAYPDEDWLSYLAYAFTHSTHAAIGGPNIVPDEDGNVAKCVANSPGGPAHVLIDDDMAEHIPGCNLAVLKRALVSIGGFDTVFRSAGDDVDICWRLQDAGYTIGFHHAAVVWHHRRNSIRAYWKQQKGYGKAEALLEKKWPEKYNALGHYAWSGSIYGNSNTLPLTLKKEKIFYGSCGSALFQSVYQPAGSMLSLLPLMPEWLILCGSFLMTSLASLIWTPLSFAWVLFVLSISIVIGQSLMSALKNFTANNHEKKWNWVLLTTFLHIIQPVSRLIGRLKNGLTPWRKRGVATDTNFNFTAATRNVSVWSEKWRSPEEWLSQFEKNLVGLKARVVRGKDFDAWDLQSRNDLFVRLRSTLLVEEHGGGRQYVKLKYTKKVSVALMVVVVCCVIASLGLIISGEYIFSGALLMLCVLAGFRVVRGIASSYATLHAAFTRLEELNKEDQVKLLAGEGVTKKLGRVKTDLKDIIVNTDWKN